MFMQSRVDFVISNKNACFIRCVSPGWGIVKRKKERVRLKPVAILQGESCEVFASEETSGHHMFTAKSVR